MKPTAEDPITFPILSADEIDTLRHYGQETSIADGEALWNAGDVNVCCFVVLKGGIIIRNTVGEADIVAYHSAGQFSGDVDVLSGLPAAIGGYADGATTALQVSSQDLREVVRVEQNLGGKILAAFIRRREILLGTDNHGVIIIGSTYDPETFALRTFLGRNRVVHRWQKPEDEDTAKFLSAFGLSAADTPLVVAGNKRLVHPKLEDLGTLLGVRLKTDNTHYDLVIVGAGPAGLAAAVYGASEGLETLLLDQSGPGGQASWSSRIENYMGFPEGISGSDLAARGLVQARKFGACLSVPAKVTKIDCDGAGQRLHLATGEIIESRAALIATGANYQKLDIPSFSKFETSGIYYAATGMEAGFCSDTEVMVIGAGNSAGQAAVFLSQTTKKVRLIVRGNQLNKNMSDYLSYRVEQIPNIEVLLETEISELHGDDKLESITLKGKCSDQVACSGLFVFIGATPNTAFVHDTVSTDKDGFILTGDAVHKSWELSRSPFYLETSSPGIFAAGDCRVGSVKRVASSVGEGSMAVTFVHRFLSL